MKDNFLIDVFGKNVNLGENFHLHSSNVIKDAFGGLFKKPISFRVVVSREGNLGFDVNVSVVSGQEMLHNDYISVARQHNRSLNVAFDNAVSDLKKAITRNRKTLDDKHSIKDKELLADDDLMDRLSSEKELLGDDYWLNNLSKYDILNSLELLKNLSETELMKRLYMFNELNAELLLDHLSKEQLSEKLMLDQNSRLNIWLSKLLKEDLLNSLKLLNSLNMRGWYNRLELLSHLNEEDLMSLLDSKEVWSLSDLPYIQEEHVPSENSENLENNSHHKDHSHDVHIDKNHDNHKKDDTLHAGSWGDDDCDDIHDDESWGDEKFIWDDEELYDDRSIGRVIDGHNWNKHNSLKEFNSFREEGRDIERMSLDKALVKMYESNFAEPIFFLNSMNDRLNLVYKSSDGAVVCVDPSNIDNFSGILPGNFLTSNMRRGNLSNPFHH